MRIRALERAPHERGIVTSSIARSIRSAATPWRIAIDPAVPLEAFTLGLALIESAPRRPEEGLFDDPDLAPGVRGNRWWRRGRGRRDILRRTKNLSGHEDGESDDERRDRSGEPEPLARNRVFFCHRSEVAAFSRSPHGAS